MPVFSTPGTNWTALGAEPGGPPTPRPLCGHAALLTGSRARPSSEGQTERGGGGGGAPSPPAKLCSDGCGHCRSQCACPASQGREGEALRATGLSARVPSLSTDGLRVALSYRETRAMGLGGRWLSSAVDASEQQGRPGPGQESGSQGLELHSLKFVPIVSAFPLPVCGSVTF